MNEESAYFIDNKIIIDNNIHIDKNDNKQLPIITRVFTQEEKDANNIGALKVNQNYTDVVIDQSIVDNDLTLQMNNLADKLINEISQKTTDLIKNKGFVFDGYNFSTSKEAQMNLGNLVNMDNIGLIDWTNPYPYSTGDHKGDYFIQNKIALHSMATAMVQAVTPLLRAGSALEKQITDIAAETQATPPTKTISEAILALKNFTDTRQ